MLVVVLVLVSVEVLERSGGGNRKRRSGILERDKSMPVGF